MNRTLLPICQTWMTMTALNDANGRAKNGLVPSSSVGPDSIGQLHTDTQTNELDCSPARTEVLTMMRRVLTRLLQSSSSFFCSHTATLRLFLSHPL